LLLGLILEKAFSSISRQDHVNEMLFADLSSAVENLQLISPRARFGETT